MSACNHFRQQQPVCCLSDLGNLPRLFPFLRSQVPGNSKQIKYQVETQEGL